jgi:serine/threonine protein kinase
MDDYMKAAFKEEIKVLSKINSEFVVGLREVIESPNNYYIIQEYCDGGDLMKLMKKEKIFSEKTAVTYMRQILLGIY